VTSKQVVELVTMRQLVANGEARQIRVDCRLSLAEMAAPIGVSAAAVSRWETGQRRPSGRPAIAYARLLVRLRKGEQMTEASDH
jgi:DNA-binding transcriptional regulator YiaG